MRPFGLSFFPLFLMVGCGGGEPVVVPRVEVAKSESDQTTMVLENAIDPARPRPKEPIRCRGRILVAQGKTLSSEPHIEVRRKGQIHNMAELKLQNRGDGQGSDFTAEIGAPRSPGAYEIVIVMQFEPPPSSGPPSKGKTKPPPPQLVSKPLLFEVVAP